MTPLGMLCTSLTLTFAQYDSICALCMDVVVMLTRLVCLHAQIGQKLQKAKAAVATAERATAGHESALTEQERQKKWIKF